LKVPMKAPTAMSDQSTWTRMQPKICSRGERNFRAHSRCTSSLVVSRSEQKKPWRATVAEAEVEGWVEEEVKEEVWWWWWWWW